MTKHSFVRIIALAPNRSLLGLTVEPTYCVDPSGPALGLAPARAVGRIPQQPGARPRAPSFLTCAVMWERAGSPAGRHRCPTVQNHRRAPEVRRWRKIRVGWEQKPWLSSASLLPTLHVFLLFYQAPLNHALLSWSITKS